MTRFPILRKAVRRATSASRGFTMIEMLIVVALMGISLTLAAPVLDTLVQTEDLGSQTDLVVDALREAQSAAMTGYGGGAFGVHFTSDGFTYFAGTSYNPSEPTNIVNEFSGFVDIIDVTLVGGGSDVIFRNHRGTPEQTGSVTLSEVGGTENTVVIGGAGLIEVQ